MFAFSLNCFMLFRVSQKYSYIFFAFSPWSSISNTQISTSTPRNIVYFCTRKYCSMKVSCPPQSQRLSVSVPMNLNLCSCLSTVYPIFWVSFAGKLAKMTECMEVLPAPEQPISSIFFMMTKLLSHQYIQIKYQNRPSNQLQQGLSFFTVSFPACSWNYLRFLRMLSAAELAFFEDSSVGNLLVSYSDTFWKAAATPLPDLALSSQCLRSFSLQQASTYYVFTFLFSQASILLARRTIWTLGMAYFYILMHCVLLHYTRRL